MGITGDSCGSREQEVGIRELFGEDLHEWNCSTAADKHWVSPLEHFFVRLYDYIFDVLWQVRCCKSIGLVHDLELDLGSISHFLRCLHHSFS